MMHLLDSLDNIGEAEVWCGAVNPESSTDPDVVDCVPCLRASVSYGKLVKARYDALTSEAEAKGTCPLCGGDHKTVTIPLDKDATMTATTCPNVILPCKEFYERGERFAREFVDSKPTTNARGFKPWS